jgi:hypothetical protein
MIDSAKKGFLACVQLDTWIIHRKDDHEDEGYRQWKMQFVSLTGQRPDSGPMSAGEYSPGY